MMNEPELKPYGALDDHIFSFYVYEYRDPRNNEVFYVGKGQRDRVDNVRGEVSNGSKREVHPAERKIDEIKEAGYRDCLRIIVGCYETEAEAYSVETTLINWVYGLDGLANINPGRRSRYVRNAKQRNGFLADPAFNYPSVEGLDRPKRKQANAGEYTDEQRRRIKENKIEEKLEFLVEELRYAKGVSSKLWGLEVVEWTTKRPQDPEVYISVDGAPVRFQLKLQLSGQTVKLNLRPVDGAKASVGEFSSYLENCITRPYGVRKKDGVGLRGFVEADPRHLNYTEINQIINLLADVRDRVLERNPAT